MEQPQEYVVTVRYGAMGHKANLPGPLPDLIRGEEVIARTERGVEFATVLTRPQPCEPPAEPPPPDRCCILRRATDADRKKLKQIEEENLPQEIAYCDKMIKQHGLPMRLVTAEHIFGGNRIIFYFLADNRVDFRNLVKDLARQFQTRIELRQIGVRDEARLMADYEHCGRELCCRTFLNTLEPVTMRMAKNQKATLDPSKISGRCGRLMCCLRYENEVYEELRRNLPAKGAVVETPYGKGVVKEREILAQKVQVEVEGHGTVLLHVDDLSAQPAKRQKPRRDLPEAPPPYVERPEKPDARRPSDADSSADLPAATAAFGNASPSPAQAAASSESGSRDTRKRRRRRRKHRNHSTDTPAGGGSD